MSEPGLYGAWVLTADGVSHEVGRVGTRGAARRIAQAICDQTQGAAWWYVTSPLDDSVVAEGSPS